MLGAVVECPACGDAVVPEVVVGASYPETGYQITYRSFCQLLTDPLYRPHVLPLLRDWFGYDVRFASDTLSIIAADGSDVPPVAVHQDIQGNAELQCALYQTAMSLWR